MSFDFHSKSYALHSKSYEGTRIEDEYELYKDWFNNGTVDIWRHLRMLRGLDPILEGFPGADWLTVGDGHFATSALYINQHGGHALPTDIDGRLLEMAYAKGMISSYRLENAEDLSFPDESFDFVFCKEAFHHFPRPYLALYEMIRCARKAIILSEPRDYQPLPLPKELLQLMKELLKRLIGKKLVHPDTGNYEDIGNYIFTISRREIEKAAMAMNLPLVAFREFHDAYIEGVEYEKLEERGPLFRKVRRKIRRAESMSKFGLTTPNRIMAIIFKSVPDVTVLDGLRSIGFSCIELPANPFA